MKLLKPNFAPPVAIVLFTTCDQWNGKTFFVHFASDEALGIENPQLTATVFGYDRPVTDAAAAVITVKEVKCMQNPGKTVHDFPDNTHGNLLLERATAAII